MQVSKDGNQKVVSGPLARILNKKKSGASLPMSSTNGKTKGSASKSLPVAIDPLIEAEDREIARLEKQLGLNKGSFR